MKRITLGPATIWSTILLISVLFAAFVSPVLPEAWHRASFRIVYSVIYISSIFSLEKRGNYLLILFVSTLFLEWLSGILNLSVLLIISKGVNIIFFLVIVVSLIKQIATARQVSPGVIVDSIVGYLLLGIIFSVLILFIIQRDPSAFSIHQTEAAQSEENLNTSVPLYYSFVTLATLGYGDIVPLKPYTRSLSTLIAITGQFYIAIIVALLVGKFSSQQNST